MQALNLTVIQEEDKVQALIYRKPWWEQRSLGVWRMHSLNLKETCGHGKEREFKLKS
jgi:hypothetical protein